TSLIICRDRTSGAHEFLPVDVVDERPTPGRRKRQSEGAFREAIYGHQRRAAESEWRKARSESFESARAHALRAVEREPDGAEVHPFQLVVGDLVQTQLPG